MQLCISNIFFLKSGWTPMIWASYKGHVNIVKELLHYGADHRQSEQVTVKR